MSTISVMQQDDGYSEDQDASASPSLSRSTAADLRRHGTILAPDGTASNAAQLKTLLGNSRAKLKPGTAALIGATKSSDPVLFEQAKTRARVEVDIFLESETCVQGGYMKGMVEIRVAKREDLGVSLADEKLRVVGFESILNDGQRSAFYQFASSLASLSTSGPQLFPATPDPEGFTPVKDGTYNIPFSIHLPIKDNPGNSKGVIYVARGSVRYIILLSLRVKDRQSGKMSIAHFYRNCEVWPRMNPAAILAPASRPITASTSQNLFLAGAGKLRLTASLHRVNWVAGQRCYVCICVANDSSKTVKDVSIALLRTVTIYKDTEGDQYRTHTSEHKVAETTIEACQRATSGYVSAKGWWAGVAPGQQGEFSHSILIPTDALSYTGGRLLEVTYRLRVSASAGSIKYGVHAITLPIHIVNMLSLDPPPNSLASYDTPAQSSEGDIPVSSFDRQPYDTAIDVQDTENDPSCNGVIGPDSSTEDDLDSVLRTVVTEYVPQLESYPSHAPNTMATADSPEDDCHENHHLVNHSVDDSAHTSPLASRPEHPVRSKSTQDRSSADSIPPRPAGHLRTKSLPSPAGPRGLDYSRFEWRVYEKTASLSREDDPSTTAETAEDMSSPSCGAPAYDLPRLAQQTSYSSERSEYSQLDDIDEEDVHDCEDSGGGQSLSRSQTPVKHGPEEDDDKPISQASTVKKPSVKSVKAIIAALEGRGVA